MEANRTDVTGRKSHEKGQAYIELVVVLPLLIFLLMGLFDYSRAVHAKSVITNMSREAANLIARANMNLSGDEAKDFQDVLDLIGKTAQPLDMVHQGMMYISKIEFANNANKITRTLSWNRSTLSPTPSSKINISGQYPTVPAQNLGGLTLSSGKTTYVVEVFYKYESLFPANAFSPTLYSISIY